MLSKGKSIRDYHRKDGFVYVVDHITKTVSVPQSVDEKDYPEEVTEQLKIYFKQLNIE